MKKGILIFSLIVVLLFGLIFLIISSSYINSVTANECIIETEKIIKITDGTSNDIIFSDTHGRPLLY